jgi:hypothetical protein
VATPPTANPPSGVGQCAVLSVVNGWVKGLWTLFVAPAVLWTFLGGLAMATGAARSLGEAWRRLALPVVVVVSAGHMAKGLAKLASWGGFLPGGLRDPIGRETALAISNGVLSSPSSLVGMQWISAISLLIFLAGTVFAVREARLADPARWLRLTPAVITLALGYGFVLIGW